jgi:ElaB/YqjD/DUF883 family membrane-anchored ribosome-binding protein
MSTSTSMSRSTQAIAKDFDTVVADAHKLLETIGNEGDARLVDAKKRMQASLAIATDRLAALQATVTDGALSAAKTTDDYVHANAWAVVGAGAAFGLAVGYLLGQRQDRAEPGQG